MSSTPGRNLDVDAFSAECPSLNLARSLWSALEPTKNAGESPVSGLILERCWHPCFLATVHVHRVVVALSRHFVLDPLN